MACYIEPAADAGMDLQGSNNVGFNTRHDTKELATFHIIIILAQRTTESCIALLTDEILQLFSEFMLVKFIFESVHKPTANILRRANLHLL